MSESENKEKLLQTLESIDGTLKRLEQLLSGNALRTVISESVTNVLYGSNHIKKDS